VSGRAGRRAERPVIDGTPRRTALHGFGTNGLADHATPSERITATRRSTPSAIVVKLAFDPGEAERRKR
jgi:hypothetical protein